MQIHLGSLFWPAVFPAVPLEEPAERLEMYDAIIVGGGMSGALTAQALINKGLKIAILDKRQVAAGSTSANTGLLQYSNDIMLHELIEQIGEKNAVAFYRLCLEAMSNLKEVAQSLTVDAQLINRSSIYYASKEEDASRLMKEFDALRKYGFPCDYWGKGTLLDKTGIDRPAALITYGDAEVNPYAFANGIFEEVRNKGGHIFEFTDVEDVKEMQDGSMLLQTSSGPFNAKDVIFTTGYETVPVGERIGADLNRSFVIVTEPIQKQPWHENALIWETKRPYLYMRTTVDGRIIVGGLDEEVGEMPSDDDLIRKRGEELKRHFLNIFPDLDVSIDFSYCATFGESLDNLPFIGEHPTKRHHYYLLGYGGNGTVYSMIGAKILAEALTGGQHPGADIVKLDRPLLTRNDGKSVVQ